MHKFGVLGYPYSSTPTGAPGPGPHTVPSAVGPGPRQGTGTHGLGHAESRSVSTALSPNGTCWRLRLCEPDPVFTRARSSFPSSTCHRRRRLRRQPLRPRHFRHRWRKRVVEWTPAEEWTLTRKLMMLPGPRTRLHKPRRLYMFHATLRRRKINSVMALAVPYA